MLGHWEVDWLYDWTNLAEAPTIVEGNKIKVMTKVRWID